MLAGAPVAKQEMVKAQDDQMVRSGQYAEARRLAMALQQGSPQSKADAGVVLTSVAQAQANPEGVQLYEAGAAALGRGDLAQARAYFSGALKKPEGLSAEQKHRMQECLNSGDPMPRTSSGRAIASDAVTAFTAGQAQPPAAPQPAEAQGPISQAKERELVELQRLRRDVIRTLDEAQRISNTNPQSIQQPRNPLITLGESTPTSR